MAAVSGRAGSVTFTAGYTTKIRSWTISVEADEIDVTSWDDYSEFPGDNSEMDAYLGGRVRWSGSFSGLLDAAGAPLPDTLTLGGNEAAAAATFVVRDGSTDAAWSGNIIITGIESTNSFDGTPEITYSFRGTGNLEYTAYIA